jgi:ABC-type nitrate/sulfonate/bicarbonate transport system substrate-binding protein
MTRPSTSRLAVWTLVLLSVTAWSGSGCAPSDKPTGPAEKITIAFTTSPNAALVHIAFAKGYFAEEGLDAVPQPHAFGKLALDAVNAGKADLATAADTPIVFAVMNGRKIMTLAVIQTANMNEAVIARRDRGIATPSDLLGKKIGYTPRTSSDFFTYSFLLFHGIDEGQVKRIGMDPGNMAEALDAGRVDAVSTWTPYLRILQKKLGSNGVVFYGEKLYTETFCVIATQEYVKRNPEAVKKALRALMKAETFVKRHPGESRRLVADFTGTDKAVVEGTWDLFTFKVALDQALLVNFEDQTRWVMKNRLATRTDMPNYLDFIYDNGLRSVKPEAVRIVR